MMKKGFKHSLETKDKISQSLQGREISDETKRKMSLSQIGHVFKGKRNYKMSEVAKDNIRNGIKEKRYNKEYAQKLSKTKNGSLNHQSKLSESQVIEIRNLHETGNWTHQALADKFNIKRPTVSDIINRRTWKHI